MRGLFGKYFIVLVIYGLTDLPTAWCTHPCRDSIHFCNTFHCLQVGSVLIPKCICRVNKFLCSHYSLTFHSMSCKSHTSWKQQWLLKKTIIRAKQEPKTMRTYFQNPFALILHLLCRNELSNPDSGESWQTGNSQRGGIIWYQLLLLMSVLPSQNFYKDSITVLPAMLG